MVVRSSGIRAHLIVTTDVAASSLEDSHLSPYVVYQACVDAWGYASGGLLYTHTQLLGPRKQEGRHLDEWALAALPYIPKMHYCSPAVQLFAIKSIVKLVHVVVVAIVFTLKPFRSPIQLTRTPSVVISQLREEGSTFLVQRKTLYKDCRYNKSSKYGNSMGKNNQ